MPPLRKHFLISPFTTLAAAILAWPGVAAAQSLNVDETIHGTPAQLLENASLEYPPDELRRQREGWVVLSYVVTNEGTVADPIIEDSSGSRAFEQSALSAIGELLYEPAMWNGKPVEQSFTNIMITFSNNSIPSKFSPYWPNSLRAGNATTVWLIGSPERSDAN